jgi:hypothetical protein
MGHLVVQDYADLPQRAALLFLTWQELSATRSDSNQLMTLSGQESQVPLRGLRRPFRQPVDQIDLTCAEPTAQDLLQTKSGKTPLLFEHGRLVVRRQQDVLTLRCANECLHCTHRPDSCPATSAPDNGR